MKNPASRTSASVTNGLGQKETLPPNSCSFWNMQTPRSLAGREGARGSHTDKYILVKEMAYITSTYNQLQKLVKKRPIELSL